VVALAAGNQHSLFLRTPFPPPPGPAIVAAVSWMQHGRWDERFVYDLLSPNAVECRVEPRGGLVIIVTFDAPIQCQGGSVYDCVLASDGEVMSASYTHSYTAQDSLVVRVNHVTDRAALTLAFPNLTHADDTELAVTDELCFGILNGDVNADGVVNIFDLVAVRNQLDQPVGDGNFRADVNVSGKIDLSDLDFIRNAMNNVLTATCP